MEWNAQGMCCPGRRDPTLVPDVTFFDVGVRLQFSHTVVFTIFPYIVALVHTAPYVDLYHHYRRRTLAKVPRQSSIRPPLFSQTGASLKNLLQNRKHKRNRSGLPVEVERTVRYVIFQGTNKVLTFNVGLPSECIPFVPITIPWKFQTVGNDTTSETKIISWSRFAFAANRAIIFASSPQRQPTPTSRTFMHYYPITYYHTTAQTRTV